MELIHNPAFCSASTAKKRYRQELAVKAQSSRAVPLVIIPLELGLHDIEVKANVRGHFVGDGVRKTLKVVVSPESSPSDESWRKRGGAGNTYPVDMLRSTFILLSS